MLSVTALINRPHPLISSLGSFASVRGGRCGKLIVGVISELLLLFGRASVTAVTMRPLDEDYVINIELARVGHPW